MGSPDRLTWRRWCWGCRCRPSPAPSPWWARSRSPARPCPWTPLPRPSQQRTPSSWPSSLFTISEKMYQWTFTFEKLVFNMSTVYFVHMNSFKRISKTRVNQSRRLDNLGNYIQERNIFLMNEWTTKRHRSKISATAAETEYNHSAMCSCSRMSWVQTLVKTNSCTDAQRAIFLSLASDSGRWEEGGLMQWA